MTTAHLLQPLTEGGPCGIPLLYEPEYDAIAAARQEDDPTLPQGAWATTLKRADWKEAARLCEKALAERSKDLQVAAWLGEAWIANEGLAGGLRATQLVQGLCDAFWEGLHPLPRNGDIEFRTAPFDWADEHWTMSLVLRAPLVRGTGADARTVTLAQWREVMAQENDERKNKKPPSDSEKTGVLTRDRVMTQLATMPMSECVAALDAARAWTAAVDELHAALDRHLPEAAPRLRKLRKTLSDSEDVLRQCVEQHPDFVERRAPEPELEPVPVLQDVVEAGPAPVVAPAPAPDHISGREDAYQRLSVIADYLAKADPHSPVPTLVRRAIAWGRMPFEELLAELTHNNNEMQRLLVRGPIDK